MSLPLEALEMKVREPLWHAPLAFVECPEDRCFQLRRRIRIDQRTEQWAEIVLDDGKVGWIPVGAMEVI